MQPSTRKHPQTHALLPVHTHTQTRACSACSAHLCPLCREPLPVLPVWKGLPHVLGGPAQRGVGGVDEDLWGVAAVWCVWVGLGWAGLGWVGLGRSAIAASAYIGRRRFEGSTAMATPSPGLRPPPAPAAAWRAQTGVCGWAGGTWKGGTWAAGAVPAAAPAAFSRPPAVAGLLSASKGSKSPAAQPTPPAPGRSSPMCARSGGRARAGAVRLAAAAPAPATPSPRSALWPPQRGVRCVCKLRSWHSEGRIERGWAPGEVGFAGRES